MKRPVGTVCIAMSGGVDSSVVAAVLRRRGYDLVGVTMQIWQESQVDPRHAGCCSLGAVEDARRVARMLEIPHYVVNFKDAFKETVIDEFIDEYGAGRTPNPCVTCNKKVKFEALLQKAEELGCSHVATGHYARVRFDAKGERWRLMRSRSKTKDQSYVLYMLDQSQLGRVMFPMGELESKAEARGIASAYELPVAHKPESQEICFVNEAGGYREFLLKQKPELLRPGRIVMSTGEVLGEHKGVSGFTVGQRRGTNVASKSGRPLYVLRIEPATETVVVGFDEELLKNEVNVTDLFWSSGVVEDRVLRVKAKIRYNMEAQPARLIPGEEPKVVFDEPVRAVTPGQIVVCYRGETVVAGGKIG